MHKDGAAFRDDCSLPLTGALGFCNAAMPYQSEDTRSYPWQIPVVKSFVLHWSELNQRARSCCAGCHGILYNGMDRSRRCCSACLTVLKRSVAHVRSWLKDCLLPYTRGHFWTTWPRAQPVYHADSYINWPPSKLIWINRKAHLLVSFWPFIPLSQHFPTPKTFQM